jgi:glycine dehydrogenase subunit 2
MMIEPTETESRDTLDKFVEIMKELAELVERSPGVFKDFPKNSPVGRVDEVKAAKDMDVACLHD